MIPETTEPKLVALRRLARYACGRWSSLPRKHPDWDDVFQVAWIAAARADNEFDPARGVSWEHVVIRYCRNAILNYQARSIRPGGIAWAPRGIIVEELPTSDDDNDASKIGPASRGADPADLAAAAEVSPAIVAGLRSLHARDRRAFLLHADGRTYAVIGAELGICDERARQIVERAAIHLRRYLARAGYVPAPQFANPAPIPPAVGKRCWPESRQLAAA